MSQQDQRVSVFQHVEGQKLFFNQAKKLPESIHSENNDECISPSQLVKDTQIHDDDQLMQIVLNSSSFIKDQNLGSYKMSQVYSDRNIQNVHKLPIKQIENYIQPEQKFLQKGNIQIRNLNSRDIQQQNQDLINAPGNQHNLQKNSNFINAGKPTQVNIVKLQSGKGLLLGSTQEQNVQKIKLGQYQDLDQYSQGFGKHQAVSSTFLQNSDFQSPMNEGIATLSITNMGEGFGEMCSNSYQKEFKDFQPINQSSSNVLFYVTNNSQTQQENQTPLNYFNQQKAFYESQQNMIFDTQFSDNSSMKTFQNQKFAQKLSQQNFVQQRAQAAIQLKQLDFYGIQNQSQKQLRNGPNGVVLETTYSGTNLQIKKTALTPGFLKATKHTFSSNEKKKILPDNNRIMNRPVTALKVKKNYNNELFNRISSVGRTQLESALSGYEKQALTTQFQTTSGWMPNPTQDNATSLSQAQSQSVIPTVALSQNFLTSKKDQNLLKFKKQSIEKKSLTKSLRPHQTAPKESLAQSFSAGHILTSGGDKNEDIIHTSIKVDYGFRDQNIGFPSDYQTTMRNEQNLFVVKLSTNKNSQITIKKDQSLTAKNRNNIDKDKLQGPQQSFFDKEFRPKTAFVGVSKKSNLNKFVSNETNQDQQIRNSQGQFSQKIKQIQKISKQYSFQKDNNSKIIQIEGENTSRDIQEQSMNEYDYQVYDQNTIIDKAQVVANKMKSIFSAKSRKLSQKKLNPKDQALDKMLKILMPPDSKDQRTQILSKLVEEALLKKEPHLYSPKSDQEKKPIAVVQEKKSVAVVQEKKQKMKIKDEEKALRKLPSSEQIILMNEYEILKLNKQIQESLGDPLTVQTVDQNAMVEKYYKMLSDAIDVLDFDEQWVGPLEEIQKVNGEYPSCQSLLFKMNSQIKSMLYLCKNVVAKDQDQLFNVKVPPPVTDSAEGKKESADDFSEQYQTNISLLKDCHFYCILPVKNRIAPLKITLKQNDEVPNFKLYGDLKICISSYNKKPQDRDCQLKFLNPDRGRFVIGDLASKKQQQIERNHKNKNNFQSQFIYMSIISDSECNITISCSFPQELRALNQIKDNDKDPNSQYVRGSAKSIRAMFKKQVNDLITEMHEDPYAQEKYFQELAEKKKQIRMENSAHSMVNFFKFNLAVAQNFKKYRQFQSEARAEHGNRLLDAKEVVQNLEDQRQKKFQLNMIKWDLFRQRKYEIECEIEVENKKRINCQRWYKQFIFHKIYNTLNDKFKQKKEQVKQAKLEYTMQVRIKRFYKKFILRKGDDFDERDVRTIRNALLFRTLNSFENEQEAKAKDIVTQAVLEIFQVRNIIHKFKTTVGLVVGRIRSAIKVWHNFSEFRKIRLWSIFERERKIMQNYYTLKKDKKKTQKALLSGLKDMSENNRNIVLEVYYTHKLVSQNLINEIIYYAQKSNYRGERGEEGYPDFGKFRKKEMLEIQALQRNIAEADAFLFKSARDDQKEIGECDYSDLQFIKLPKKKEAFNNKDVEDQQSQQSDGNSEEQETIDKEEKGKKSKKSDSKPKSKSSEKGFSANKKSKKQKKTDRINDEDQQSKIPAYTDVPKKPEIQFTKFLDRITIQQLVRRAAELKVIVLPAYEQVRPYFVNKSLNQDLID